MIKVGVIGAGHLGKIHLNILNKSEQYDLIGFHDNDQKNVLEIQLTLWMLLTLLPQQFHITKLL